MAADQQNAISLRSVSLSYGATSVLDKLDLDLPGRQLTAIVGRSGCGKSTLIKLVNGLLRPDRGSVLINGQSIDYDALPELRRDMGYAVQGTGLFPHLSVADNITLLARLNQQPAADIENRLHELLQMMQLSPELLPRFPYQLSGGQQQRVGLCRALFLNPPFLLLDEPFAAVDPLNRIEIQQQMLAIQQHSPRTCLLVTHDMGEAMRLADHILVMGQGRIITHTSTEALRSEQNEADPDLLLLKLLEREQ